MDELSQRDRPASSRGHLVGMDTLRAVAAIIVMVGHLGITPQIGVGGTRLLQGGGRLLFDGPAAVIVFFVISGFFIHLPQSRSPGSLDVKSFYARRAIRIGIPAAVAFSISLSLHVIDLGEINKSIFWSIICEAIYYSLYPLLLLMSRKVGWTNLIIAAYFLATALCLNNLNTLYHHGPNAYPALGFLTWIVGLPCWLLGCWLAENKSLFGSVSQLRIWIFRASIFGIATFVMIARFHFHSAAFSECFTLNLFALPVTAWIGLELASSSRLGVSQVLERMGQWSYSLYLIHPMTPKVLNFALRSHYHEEWYYVLRLAFALTLSYVFYRIVELPSHRLALRVGRRLKNRAAAPSVVSLVD